MKHTFTWGDTELVLDIVVERDALRVRLPDGTERIVQVRRLTENRVEIIAGNRILRVATAAQEQGAIVIGWAGESYRFERVTGPTMARSPQSRKSTGTLIAPMVGVVAAVLVEVGAHVDRYQPVAVIEAMKVLATVEAPFAGTVASVAVQPGEPVRHGQVLLQITPNETAPEKEETAT
jgi:biotin carboxyl carrier protein